MTQTGWVERLHAEKCSCVVDGPAGTYVGRQRGVADLYRWLTEEPAVLRGARVADKVIGKGAAALLVLGGATAVHADVISRPARELLRRNGVEVTFGEEVDHIINRSRTGWCPVESLCRDEESPERMLALITGFLQTHIQTRRNNDEKTTNE